MFFSGKTSPEENGVSSREEKSLILSAGSLASPFSAGSSSMLSSKSSFSVSRGSGLEEEEPSMKGSSEIKFSSESSLVSENSSAPESEESDKKICSSRAREMCIRDRCLTVKE